MAEVVDEIPDDSQLVTDTDFKIEDTPKKSYASIVSGPFIIRCFL